MSVITVVIPVYNVAGYLKAALNSLIAQTIQEWTAICVDDGSTDGSGEILDTFAAQDSRFTVIHQPNRGVSAARNVGLDCATSEIVAFLDPDDLVEPEWLAKLHAGIQDVDLVWGGMIRHEKGMSLYDGPHDGGVVYRGDAVRRRVWRAVFGYRLRDLPKAILPGGLWRQCRREFGAVVCRAFRRSVVGDLRFDERLRLGEDAFFLAAFAKRAISMRVIGDTGYRYFIRAKGALMTEGQNRMVPYKFAARDIRREIDPGLTHGRGSFLLSAVEVLRLAGFGAFVRYVTCRPA